jgi:D-amino peptidase
MKIFMHWDMEGTSGLFTREHTWFWEEGARPQIAEEGRKLLMADINSAVTAALEAGVDELIVCDTHHGGGNICIEEMLKDKRVTYHVKPRDSKSRWMPGLDTQTDGLMLMGHHAKAGTDNAFLPHTWMEEWADFRINGMSVGEPGIESCFAAYWDIPVILFQGDETACREAEEHFPGIITAPVKRALSHDTCTGPDAESARRLTAEKIREAIQSIGKRKFTCFKPALPMTITIRMKTEEGANKAAQKPLVRRLDKFTIERQVDRHCDVVQWIASAGLQ